MELHSKQLGTINAGIRCVKCKTEMRSDQRARQISILKWETDPKTPCTCGSTVYESYVVLGNGNSCPPS